MLYRCYKRHFLTLSLAYNMETRSTMYIKKAAVIICLFFCYAFAKAQQPLQQFKRAKIFLNESHTLGLLNQLEVSADHGLHKQGEFIISDFSNLELDIITQAGYHYDVLIEDVKKAYKQQNRESTIPTRNIMCSDDNTSYTTPTNFNQGSMGGYLTYQELLDELDDMATQYPDLITARAPISNFLTEGQEDNSVTPSIGNNPIYWLKISDNPNSNESEPEVLYTSIHHAREPMSLMQLVFYMWYLLENYETDTEVQAIVNNTELYFIPVVNPDGYLYNEVTDPDGGGLWRKNRKFGTGVDNNRNYDYHIEGDPTNGSWGGPGSSSNPNSQTHHGTGPFSEIETQAVKWFVEQHDFVIALNNHSFGQLLYYPFGYADVNTPDNDLFEGLGAQLTSLNGYTALNDFPFAGDSDDFMYGTVGTHNKIFAFTPEIGTSFWPPANTIESIAQDMMFLNLTAAQAAGNYGLLIETSPVFTEDTTTLSTSFNVQRIGVENTGDFTVSLSPVSTNIIENGSPVTLSNIAPLEIQSQNISYTVSSDIEIGDPIEFDLIIDNGIFQKPIRISKIYGNTTDLLTNNGDNTANFTNTNWGTSSTTFVSPSSSITDSPSGNYGNNATSAITIAEGIDLTEATTAFVSFYAQWDIEDTWDYVQFEVSKDNGTTWEPQCGDFTTLGTNIQPTGQPLYDGTQNDWVFEEINLSDYLGETIIARFRLSTDGAITRDGFYFDDLTFSVISNAPLSLQENTFLDSFSLFPNPVSEELTIVSNINSYQSSIYNLLGQKISTTIDQHGNTTIDYTNFPKGIYFLKLETEEKSVVFKIIKK